MTNTACHLVRRIAGRFPLDPVAYATRYLGVRLTPQQIRVLEAIRTPPYRVLVPSANNVGKTFLAAVVASWFYDSYDPSVLLAVAPTQKSIQDVFFRTLRAVRPIPWGFSPKRSRLQDGHSHFVDGLTAAKADAFQGRHEHAIAVIFDEATGVDRTFWERAFTMLNFTLPQFFVAFYNPHDASTPPYAEEDTGRYHVIRLSALDHPNIAAELRGDPPPVPSAIRLARVLERIEAECREGDGEGSFEFNGRRYVPLTPEFEVQVLGRWPSVTLQTVWTESLYRRCEQPQPFDPAWRVQIGVDVAGSSGGDATVIAVRQGIRLMETQVLRGVTTKEIAERIRQTAYRYDRDNPRSVLVLADNTGGYGLGVVDYADGWNWHGVNACNQSPDPRFLRVRSLLWFRLVEAATAGGCDFSAVTDPKLKQQLLSTRFKIDVAGRRVVEGKSHTRARLGESPDLADAVNLAWYPAEYVT